MLIVAGIIILLIGILLPVLGRVREQGRTTTCLGNLRQLGTAATAYSAKYDKFILPNYAGEENYATLLVNEGFVTSPEVRNMNDPPLVGSTVLYCPSGYNEEAMADAQVQTAFPPDRDRASEDTDMAWRFRSNRTGKIIDTWYGINATSVNFAAIKTPSRRLPSSDTRSWQLPRLSDIKDPSRMVFLFDGVGMDLHDEADRLSARHGGNTQTNLLFFDGHAETVHTETLPGGMGPNPSGADVFSRTALQTNKQTRFMWRLDGP